MHSILTQMASHKANYNELDKLTIEQELDNISVEFRSIRGQFWMNL